MGGRAEHKGEGDIHCHVEKKYGVLFERHISGEELVVIKTYPEDLLSLYQMSLA